MLNDIKCLLLDYRPINLYFFFLFIELKTKSFETYSQIKVYLTEGLTTCSQNSDIIFKGNVSKYLSKY